MLTHLRHVDLAVPDYDRQLHFYSGIWGLTTVADVYVIYATVPFVTAGLAWLVLSEKATASVLAASGVALAGVVVTLTGARFGGSLLGQLVAFLMTVSMAFMAVIVRRHREIALFPALGLSAWMAAFVSFWFCSPFDVSSFAGQTVSISFTGTEDSSLQTSFVIDDTAVTLS